MKFYFEKFIYNIFILRRTLGRLINKAIFLKIPLERIK